MKKLFTFILLLLGVVQSTYAQEPYAVLSDDDKKLTFYYDNDKEANNGMDVGPFTASLEIIDGGALINVNSGWYEQRHWIETVVFDNSFAHYKNLTSTAYWFYNCYRLTRIYGIENLNTANVTDMADMFLGCKSLTNLDTSNFNTRKVTKMQSMFRDCENLTSLDVSNFNTAKVTNMSYMFDGCSNLTTDRKSVV